MVKKFEIIQLFQCSLADFFRILIANSPFEEEAHLARGNKSIKVTTWMTSSGSSISQRLCFYTIVDSEPNGIGNSLCMETQKFWHEKESMCMECTIVPDNPTVGNVFRIQSSWKITSISGNQCSVTIKGEVECKKSMIGLQSMVENVLSEKFRGSYQKWINFAMEFLQKIKQKEQEEENQKELRKKQEQQESMLSFSFLSQNKYRLHRRWQALQTRVMAGTENIVRLLKDGARASSAKTTDKSPSQPLTQSSVLRDDIESSTLDDIVLDLSGEVGKEFGKSESGKSDGGRILGGILAKTGKDKESDEEISKKSSGFEENKTSFFDKLRSSRLSLPSLPTSKSYFVIFFFFLFVCVFVYTATF